MSIGSVLSAKTIPVNALSIFVHQVLKMFLQGLQFLATELLTSDVVSSELRTGKYLNRDIHQLLILPQFIGFSHVVV